MPGYLTRRVDNGLTIMVERVEPDARTLCIALNNSQEHSGLRDDVHRHVGAITIGQAKPARGVRYGVAHHLPSSEFERYIPSQEMSVMTLFSTEVLSPSAQMPYSAEVTVLLEIT